MACHFYARSTHIGPDGDAHVLPNKGSNQCGLIIDAHSPCYMQVQEELEPEWHECPRNPSVLTGYPPHPAAARILGHWLYMIQLPR